MSKQKRNLLNLLLREAGILLAILLVAYLLMAEGPTNFRYPMSPTPAVKEKMEMLGKFIVYFGYPLLLLIRLLKKGKGRKS